MRVFFVGAVLSLLALVPATAAAWEPFAGAGSSTPAAKDKTPQAVRQRALGKARRAALEAALAELAGSGAGAIDKAARKAVLAAADSWTGAYRVIAERSDGDAVTIEIEADIDLARLRKRLVAAPASADGAMYGTPTIEVEGDCGEPALARTRVEDELSAAGAIGKDGAPLQLSLSCTRLGAVPHTFQFASRVELVARSGGHTLATATLSGFGVAVAAADGAAIAEAAGVVGASLAQHRRGVVSLQVLGARPASKLRRLERALLQSVPGVTAVELARVGSGGRVVLRVVGAPPGDAPAQALAQALQSLARTGLAMAPPVVEGPDALVLELQ